MQRSAVFVCLVLVALFSSSTTSASTLRGLPDVPIVASENLPQESVVINRMLTTADEDDLECVQEVTQVPITTPLAGPSDYNNKHVGCHPVRRALRSKIL